MIAFDKIALGHKFLNDEAREQKAELVQTLKGMNCPKCKQDSHIGFEAKSDQHAYIVFNMCCVEFEKIVRKNLA